jgi:hypothetical protein
MATQIDIGDAINGNEIDGITISLRHLFVTPCHVTAYTEMTDMRK